MKEIMKTTENPLLIYEIQKLNNFDQIISSDRFVDSLRIMKVPSGVLVKPRYCNNYVFVEYNSTI